MASGHTSRGPRTAGHEPAALPTLGAHVRVAQRILALTTAVWHDDHAGRPIRRSLLAYDH